MKKFAILTVVSAVLLTMGSCGNKTQPVPFDNGDSASSINQDPTIYGLCGDGTAMNTLQLVTDNGDTLNLDLTTAREAGRVMGGLQGGDRMAVLINGDKTEATQVINMTTLLGNWVMPNPMDGSSEMGVRIKEGGIAESIDQSSLVYKTWRLVNGQLELTAIREGGGDQEETALFNITKLGADSLSIKNDEDMFDFSRQQHHDPLSNIKLEEASADDYNI